jgi:hypothetical protein
MIEIKKQVAQFISDNLLYNNEELFSTFQYLAFEQVCPHHIYHYLV